MERRPKALIINVAIWMTFFIIFISQVSCGGNVDNEGLYKLLNVSKKATTKEIRISFKKIALIKHPDKNKENPKANEEFIKINRAYEILKDEELRKKYDMFGEDGLKDNHNAGQQYQNWNFYHQNFGIYDNDPEVITLTRTDFVQMVETSSDIIWFVNFYSNQCSHCHDLAPTWRELAKQLDGVVRIGAVNCGDDWLLCNQQQIRAFPSLIMYPKRIKFENEKTIENLLFFAMKYAKGKVINLNSEEKYNSELDIQEKNVKSKPWLIAYCLGADSSDDDITELNYELNCLEDIVKSKIAIALDGLVNVGSIDCINPNVKENICSNLKPSRANPIIYYTRLPNLDSEKNDAIKTNTINTIDYKEISRSILASLPDDSEINEEKLNKILDNLRDPNKFEKTWFIQFVDDSKSDENLELKKLPVLLGQDYNFGRIDCAKFKNPQDCFNRFQVHKFPTFLLFKSASYILGGAINNMKKNWFEIYYSSRINAADLTAFVKENAYTSVRTLSVSISGQSFDEFISEPDKEGYFVDFFAPWCPPCMNLLPELRKASKSEFNIRSIPFGTVDCTLNQKLCSQFHIQSYPTTIFIHKSTQHRYVGQHTASDINDFIEDTINPIVEVLTYETFKKFVSNKPIGKLWLVDFYASWCGPCQQMAPEWRKLGKRLKKDAASIGMVDCVVEQRLCAEQGITSYPNIRAYPADSFGTQMFHQYQNWMRDANNMLVWAMNFYPTKTIKLDANNFDKLVLNSGNTKPWLIDFYSPWCGPCNVFMPKFEIIAEKLEGKVKCGKVNCAEQGFLCQRVGLTGYPSIVFYAIPKTKKLDWRSGEHIYQYEIETVLHELNIKLKSHDYAQKKLDAKEEL